MSGINSNTMLILKGQTVYDACYSARAITTTSVVTSAIASALTTRAWYFNGVSTTALKWVNQTSIEFWVSDYTLDWRMQVDPYSMGAVRFFTVGSNLYRYHMMLKSNGITLFAESVTMLWSNTYLFDWNYASLVHFAVTQYTSIQRAFVNGSLVHSAVVGTLSNVKAANTYSYVTLGTLNYAAGVSSFKGWMEEFRITKGVALWTTDFTPPTAEHTYDLPVANIQTLVSNVQPLWVVNQSLQIANRFRYDTVRKIPDMSAAQVRAVLMSAGYTFDPDADHDFDSVSAHSIASVRLYPTITEDDTSDLTSVYFSDIPFSGAASTVGIMFAVAKDFTSVLDSRIICLLHGDGTDGGTTFTDSAKSKSITTGGSGTLTTASLTKKFGTAAIRPSTTSTVAFLSLSYHSDFCLGSVFTLDMWLYWSVLPVGVTSLGTEIYWCLYSTEADRALLHANWWSGNSMTLVMKQVRNNSDPYWIYSAQAGIISVNSWYHFAFCRNGSVDYAFKNGSLLASTLTSYATGASAGTVSVYTSAGFVRFFDRGTSTMPCRAICDEFRIMKGYCAWTSDFTLYAEAYAESAIWSGETIIGFLSINETIPVNETLTAKGVSVRLT